MENKPQNMFEKLDRQEEKIEDISSKLEGISINDLYALAKRTWDYGDYQTAQKYYNHISLLKPIDWEAPLYASLCNFEGSHQVDFWEYGLVKASKVIVSTINYINGLSLSLDEKNKEMTRCLKIIKEFMESNKNLYFDNKDVFDSHIPDFVSRIESFYLSIYNKTADIDLNPLVTFRVFIANGCLDLIQNKKEISSDITKEVFQKLIELSDKEFNIDYDAITTGQIESTKEKSIEEKNEIMLKGIKLFEYSDKIISQRKFKRNLIVGLLLTLISTAGFIVSFIGQWYWLFTFAFSLIYGLLLIIKAIKEKERVVCSSLLCGDRTKNRLTSNGGIVEERKFDFIFFIAIIGSCISFLTMLMSIVPSEKQNNLFIVLALIDILLSYVYSFKIKNEHMSKYNGKYLYYYKGKYYKFD